MQDLLILFLDPTILLLPTTFVDTIGKDTIFTENKLAVNLNMFRSGKIHSVFRPKESHNLPKTTKKTTTTSTTSTTRKSTTTIKSTTTSIINFSS